MNKPDYKDLTKLEIIDLTNCISHISRLNGEGYQIYDLGYQANTCLGRTFKAIKPVVATVAEEQQALDKKVEDLKALRKKALEGLKGEELAAAAEKFEADHADAAAGLRAERKAWHAEIVEKVKVYPVSWADVKYKGQCPSPEVLAGLDPILIYSDADDQK